VVNYADDLKSIAGILGSLQEQANLVSAFALVFGLHQFKAKFRAFRFPFDTPDEHRTNLPMMDILGGYGASATDRHPKRLKIPSGY
jgi:hypothetical protein